MPITEVLALFWQIAPRRGPEHGLSGRWPWKRSWSLALSFSCLRAGSR